MTSFTELGVSHPGRKKRALASSGAGIITVTVNGALAVSADGINWTPVDAPLGLDFIDIPTVVGGPSGWYLFDRIGDEAWGIFTSQDGETWNRVGTG